MSNSPLWRIKKQNPLFQKNEIQASSYDRFEGRIGHTAYPNGARSLPIMGNVLTPDGQNCGQTSAQ